MKRTVKAFVPVLVALAFGAVAVGCGEDETPETPETPKLYTITYNINGGTGTTPTETDKAAGAKFNLAASTGFSKTQYDFDGWSDGTTTYEAGAEYTMPASNVTFTAQWEAIDTPQPQGVLAYEGSCVYPASGLLPGGTVVGIRIDIDNGTAYYKLDGGEWTDGKYFDDNTDSQFKPDNYGDNALYYEIKVGAQNFYALIKPDLSKLYLCDSDDEPMTGGEFDKVAYVPATKYTVTYDLNGGEGTLPTETNKEEGAEFNLAVSTGLTKTGMNFVGWSDGTTTYDAGAKYTMPANNVTFTAQWEDASLGERYNVTFVKPAGVDGDAPEPQRIADGEKITLPANPFTRIGWTFVNWQIGDNSQQLKAPNAQIPITTDTTVKPVFKKDYSGEYGKIEARDNDTVVVDGYVYSYTREDNFVTINMGDDYLKVSVDDAAGTYILLDGMQNIVFTASDGTELSFDGIGGATLGTAKGSYIVYSNDDESLLLRLTFGTDVISDIALVLSNNTFVINTKFTVGGKEYTFGASVPVQKYTVTYNLGGGSGTVPTETNKATGEKFALALSTGLTFEGKVFDGWNDGTTKYVAGAQYTMPANNVTLTAVWKDVPSGELTWSAITIDDATLIAEINATTEKYIQYYFDAPLVLGDYTFVGVQIGVSGGSLSMKAIYYKTTDGESALTVARTSIPYMGKSGDTDMTDGGKQVYYSSSSYKVALRRGSDGNLYLSEFSYKTDSASNTPLKLTKHIAA